MIHPNAVSKRYQWETTGVSTISEVITAELINRFRSWPTKTKKYLDVQGNPVHAKE